MDNVVVKLNNGKLLLEKKEDCCGCSACFSVCPKDAITMVRDEEGFLYPQIQRIQCVSCEKCINVCRAQKKREKLLNQHIYAAKSLDLGIRMRSSSGGGFSAVAHWVEKHNGVICGVDFDDQFRAVHRFAETENQWSRFCTSKYVQSDLQGTYRAIKEYLTKDRFVLFTGTPCQVHGLHSYLGEYKSDKLLTCDVVCHGAPSPRIWADYLRYVQKQGQKGISRVNFRDKSDQGWHNSTLSVYDKDGKKIIAGEQSKDCYFQLFFRHLILRPACHNCLYANFDRPGDITLGDYWGIEKHYPEFDDDKGVSLFMCNTEKGHYVWQQIANQMDSFEISHDKCTQPNLRKPAHRPGNRELFWKQYWKYGFVETAKRVGVLPLNTWDRMKRLPSRAVSAMKRMLRKMNRK